MLLPGTLGTGALLLLYPEAAFNSKDELEEYLTALLQPTNRERGRTVLKYSFWIGNTKTKRPSNTTVASPDFLLFKWRQTGESSKCAGTRSHDPGGEHELDAKEPFKRRPECARLAGLQGKHTLLVSVQSQTSPFPGLDSLSSASQRATFLINASCGGLS